MSVGLCAESDSNVVRLYLGVVGEIACDRTSGANPYTAADRHRTQNRGAPRKQNIISEHREAGPCPDVIKRKAAAQPAVSFYRQVPASASCQSCRNRVNHHQTIPEIAYRADVGAGEHHVDLPDKPRSKPPSIDEQVSGKPEQRNTTKRRRPAGLVRGKATRAINLLEPIPVRAKLAHGCSKSCRRHLIGGKHTI